MRKRTVDETPPATAHEPAVDTGPHVIASTAIYTVCSAAKALGLPKSSLPREIRQGRLRVAKRCGRYLILGAWLLEWLEKGERRRIQEEKAGSARAMP